LYGHAKPDRFPRNPIFDLVEEEVWTARSGFGLPRYSLPAAGSTRYRP
jgi:hypothetical protein